MTGVRVAAITLMAIVLSSSVSHAAYVLVPRNSTVDVDGDGTGDLKVELCTDCGAAPNRLVHVNSSFRGFSSRSFANTDCTDVASASFVSNGPFLPSSGEVYLIKSNSGGFGKIQHNEVSSSSGMELEWVPLSCAVVDPPDSNFTFTTYDLLAFFTDTSTNDPATSWSWTFGDGGVSSSKNPSHAYASAGTYNVCLTGSNAGGTGSTTCKNVTVATVPSSTVAPGASFDFDGDTINDIQVLATGACGSIPNLIDPLGTVKWGSVSKDYRTVTIGDVGTPSSTSNFCHPVASLFDTGVFETSNGSIVKFWTPQNTASGIRFEFAILFNSVDPPDSDFTFSTYDLLAFFTDTSTNDDPSSWSWDFDDGGTSTSANPLHVFASAGTYNVCLTASNVGGTGSTMCKNVTVSLVASTTTAPGGTIDLDGDAVPDLQVIATTECGSISNKLRPLNAAKWAATSDDYRTVTLGDAPTPTSTSDFCHPVADVFSTGFVKTAGALVKFWTPQNDGSGVRFEFAVLSVTGDPLTFFTLEPCRLVDTRGADGPALAAMADRAFTIVGKCGIPSTAKAIAVAAIVTGATSSGNVRLHATGTAVPGTSSINYVSGQTRSNNAVVAISGSGELSVYVGQISGQVHFILDVTGYFE